MDTCTECGYILDAYKELSRQNSSESDRTEARINNLVWKKMRACLREIYVTPIPNDTITYIEEIQNQVESLRKMAVRLNETCPEIIKIYEMNRIYKRVLAILQMLKWNKIK